MKSATVTAPANIAFIKYWGAIDLQAAIPQNPSISMTLRECVTRTTVAVLEAGAGDEIFLEDDDGGLVEATGSFRDRALAHTARMREWAGTDAGLRVQTRNSFPASAGMASSASGFAALTVAAVQALRKEASPQELSELARSSGSGSAARSVLGGYVEWPADGPGHAAVQLAPHDHWDLRDVIALIQTGPKAVSSLEGHRRAPTSPHYPGRLAALPGRLQAVRRAIADRDLDGLGPVLEEDAIELHLVAMSSRPPTFYWHPATLRVLEVVRRLRGDRVGAWATMDAGANVHVICEPDDEGDVASALAAVAGVHDVIRDGVGAGPRLLRDSDDA